MKVFLKVKIEDHTRLLVRELLRKEDSAKIQQDAITVYVTGMVEIVTISQKVM